LILAVVTRSRVRTWYIDTSANAVNEVPRAARHAAFLWIRSHDPDTRITSLRRSHGGRHHCTGRSYHLACASTAVLINLVQAALRRAVYVWASHSRAYCRQRPRAHRSPPRPMRRCPHDGRRPCSSPITAPLPVHVVIRLPVHIHRTSRYGSVRCEQGTFKQRRATRALGALAAAS
jgi:hypothetical protein